MRWTLDDVDALPTEYYDVLVEELNAQQTD